MAYFYRIFHTDLLLLFGYVNYNFAIKKVRPRDRSGVLPLRLVKGIEAASYIRNREMAGGRVSNVKSYQRLNIPLSARGGRAPGIFTPCLI